MLTIRKSNCNIFLALQSSEDLAYFPIFPLRGSVYCLLLFSSGIIVFCVESIPADRVILLCLLRSGWPIKTSIDLPVYTFVGVTFFVSLRAGETSPTHTHTSTHYPFFKLTTHPQRDISQHVSCEQSERLSI